MVPEDLVNRDNEAHGERDDSSFTYIGESGCRVGRCDKLVGISLIISAQPSESDHHPSTGAIDGNSVSDHPTSG